MTLLAKIKQIHHAYNKKTDHQTLFRLIISIGSE